MNNPIWRENELSGFDELHFDIFRMVVANRDPSYVVVYQGTEAHAILRNGVWFYCNEYLQPKQPMNIYAKLFQGHLDTWHDFDEQREKDMKQEWARSLVVDDSSSIHVVAKGRVLLLGISEPVDDESDVAKVTFAPLMDTQVDELIQLLHLAKQKQAQWRAEHESNVK